jgi:hypothetical protein
MRPRSKLMTIEFEADALLEIQEAISYSEIHFGVDKKLNASIQRAVLEIAAEPFRFRKNHIGINIFQLMPFPMYLVFVACEESQHIRFYALAHSSRRPSYWKSRISSLP